MPVPNNDALANAISIAGNATTVSGSNVGATNEPGEDLTADGDNVFATVWYVYQPTSNGTATFDTFGSTFDTTLQVFGTTSVSPTFATLTQVAENDDAPGHGTQSQVTFGTITGTKYYIQVGGFGSNSGAFTLNGALTFTPPPTITSSSAVSVVEGGAPGSSVYQAAVSDPSQKPTYWLTGADAGQFRISTSGAVTFKTPPDFEAPVDTGGDNTYNVVVNAAVGQSAPGSKAVAITVTNAPVPSNDALANAIAITPGTYTGTNGEATVQAGEDTTLSFAQAPGDQTGRTVWYVYQPTTSGKVTVDTSGSDFDTTLQVFSAASSSPTPANLVQVAEDDDAVVPGGYSG